MGTLTGPPLAPVETEPQTGRRYRMTEPPQRSEINVPMWIGIEILAILAILAIWQVLVELE